MLADIYVAREYVALHFVSGTFLGSILNRDGVRSTNGKMELTLYRFF